MENKDLNNEVVNETIEEVTVNTEEVIGNSEEVEEVTEAKEDIQETIEEVTENREELIKNSEEVTKEDSKGVIFLRKILGGVIDQIISIALSLLLLIVVDFLLKLAGFYIAEREPMFLIMYVIVNIVYAPICTSTKLKDTIGRKTMLK